MHVKSGQVVHKSLLSEFDIILNKELESHVCGRDILTVMKKTGTESNSVGGMCIDIKKGEGIQRHNFLICISTKFRLDENKVIVSKLVSWVDRELRLIEEKRSESLVRENLEVEERAIYLTRTLDGGIYAQLNKVNEGQMFFRYSHAVINPFICEGANIILLKCLSVLGKPIPRDQKSKSLKLDASVCENLYELNYKEHDYDRNFRITRIITDAHGSPSISHADIGFLADSQARILKLKWDDNDFIVVPQIIDKSMKYLPENETYNKKLFQTKIELKGKISSRPNLVTLLDDYLQDVLIHKPEDVLQFTQMFFEKLKKYKRVDKYTK